MESCSDEELLYLMRCGNQDAERYLYECYYKEITKWLLPYYRQCYCKVEFEDLIQIGMMNFVMIIDSYRTDQNTSLKTFMKFTVTKRVMSYVKFGKYETSLLRNKSISFDEYIGRGDESMRYDEIIEDPSKKDRPEIAMKIKEASHYYADKIVKQTSQIERRVMFYMQAGYSQGEIAKMLGISIKSVYNAIYRYHKKILPIDEIK